ncbi:MAG: hypothetical protein C0453_06680 [Comamonadaceae bacterium]|nr:hypothetical protein [Comamonadaceae bacterium]
MAVTAMLCACGGGSGDDGGTALDGAGASAREVPVESADMKALLNAYTYHLGQSTPVVVGGSMVGAMVAEQGSSARSTPPGAAIDPGAIEELRPAERSRPAAVPKEARPCPAGGTVDTTDLGSVVGVRFTSCVIPVGGVLNTYNGTASVDAAPGNVRADTDVEVRTTGGGRNDVIRVFFQNLNVQSRGSACNETVTMAVGRLSGNSTAGAYSIEWRDVTSDRRPDGRDCTWNVSLRVLSDGIFSSDAGAPPVPPVRQSLIIRTLEPLRYSPSGLVGSLNLPVAGQVVLRNLESGAQTTLRIADGGVYVSVAGGETFLSNAELLARVGGG